MTGDARDAEGVVREERRKKLTVPAPSFNALSIFAWAIAMFACWLVWLIALCPGTMNWDTWYQIWQCYPNHGPVYYIPYWPTESFVDYTFSDHHPVVDSLIFGFFALTSEELTGNWNLGLFYYTMLQSLAMVMVLTASIAYLERFGLARGWRLALFLVFALMPFYPAYGATVLKDTLFSWIYALFFLMIVHVVRLKGEPLKRWYFLLALILVALALCVTKKPGLYAVLGTVVLLAIIYRKRIPQLLLCAASCGILMWVVMPGIVFPALDVVEGGKQEALGYPFQMTARYVVMHEDEVSASERKAIDAVLVYDTLADRYNPEQTDPVKFMWNWHCTDDDLDRYFKVFFEEGKKHPETYFDAWWICIDTYFVPGEPINIYDWTGSLDPNVKEKVWLPYVLKDLREGLVGAYDASVESPTLGPLFQLCLWAAWIPLACLIIVLLRRREWVPVFIPVAMSVVVLMVTPLVDARYALPILYADPVLVGIAIAAIAPRKEGLPALWDPDHPEEADAEVPDEAGEADVTDPDVAATDSDAEEGEMEDAPGDGEDTQGDDSETRPED